MVVFPAIVELVLYDGISDCSRYILGYRKRRKYLSTWSVYKRMMPGILQFLCRKETLLLRYRFAQVLAKLTGVHNE